jgi:hypothetical protein
LGEILRNFSLGLSFDLTRGVDTPTFIGSKQQLSAASVRYQFINHRDPLDKRYQKDWNDFAETVGNEYHTRFVQLWRDLTSKADTQKLTNADLQAWIDSFNTAIRGSTSTPTSTADIEAVQEMYKIVIAEVAKFPTDKIRKDEKVSASVSALGQLYLFYLREKAKLIEDKIRKGSVVSLEYTNYREVNAPDLSSFRFIAETGMAGNWDVAFNSSMTFFNKKPIGDGTNRLRDFDFSLQLEKPLSDLGFGTPTLSFAGKYQRIASNLFDPSGMIRPNTRGDTAIGQIKLVFPINGTGIKIPFSLTFANRTDLIKEKHVRGNFGVTFDLDRLFFRNLRF